MQPGYYFDPGALGLATYLAGTSQSLPNTSNPSQNIHFFNPSSVFPTNASNISSAQAQLEMLNAMSGMGSPLGSPSYGVLLESQRGTACPPPPGLLPPHGLYEISQANASQNFNPFCQPVMHPSGSAVGTPLQFAASSVSSFVSAPALPAAARPTQAASLPLVYLVTEQQLSATNQPSGSYYSTSSRMSTVPSGSAFGSAPVPELMVSSSMAPSSQLSSAQSVSTAYMAMPAPHNGAAHLGNQLSPPHRMVGATAAPQTPPSPQAGILHGVRGFSGAKHIGVRSVPGVPYAPSIPSLAMPMPKMARLPPISAT